ncbi:MAG: hypothetical protein KGR26_01860, partial [Cyanobacteria bacterium REEB65]|nr:hypothetical protein [Cyanobacteria bacterium REEB65]
MRRRWVAAVAVAAMGLAACAHLPVGALKVGTRAVSEGGAVPLSQYHGDDPAVLKLQREYRAMDLGDIVIPPNSAWEEALPVNADKTLDIDAARIEYSYAAGSNWPLDVSVDGTAITTPLLNKGMTYTYVEGRTFPYLSGGSWSLFYGPDFNLNNTPAAGRYEVVSDPGQAYHYVWSVAAIVNSETTMDVRLYNNGAGVGQPIIVRLPALSLSVVPGWFSPKADASHDTATVSIQATVPWALSVKGYGQIATGSSSQDYIWSGTVGGKKLPDGVYALELAEEGARPTLPPADATAGIDTRAPALSHPVLVGLGGDAYHPVYTYEVSRSDPAANGVSSGIAPASFAVFDPDVPLRLIGTPVASGDGTYDVQLQTDASTRLG